MPATNTAAGTSNARALVAIPRRLRPMSTAKIPSAKASRCELRVRKADTSAPTPADRDTATVRAKPITSAGYGQMAGRGPRLALDTA